MERNYAVLASPMVGEKHSPPLALIQVDHANKMDLLEETISASQAARPQTQAMLAQLREFQPSMAHLFQPKDIAISQAPLRFLCESSKQSQLDAPPRIFSYIALSYCWHGPNWTIADCLSQLETGWPISTAMFHSLLEQRESTDEGIWIDQCCINQQDPFEKQLAIGSMDLVYKGARKVVAVLEDIAISRAEKILLQNIDDDNWKPKNADLNTLSHILVRILSARWFRRAWCSHELQLSNDFVFLIPATPSPLQLSPDGLESLYSLTSDYMLQREDLVALMVQDVFRSYDFFTRTIDRKNKENHGRALISEFSDIHQLSCSCETDILSIAMNIAGFQVYFTGHLRSPNECRWALSMIALSAGDATVFDGMDEVLTVEGPARTPSWLNWGNALENTMTRVGCSKLRRPMCIKSIDQYQITLDLLEFTNCTLQHPSEYSYSRADLLVSLLFKTYMNEVPEDRPYWMRTSDNPIEGRRERRFVKEILACSFECGFDWMRNQMPQEPDLANYLQSIWGDFESRFWPMLGEDDASKVLSGSSYLDQLDEDSKRAIVLYLYFILFDAFLDLGSFPSFLSSTSSASAKDKQTPAQDDEQPLVECQWLDLGPGNKALVASRPGMVERCRLTMPVALKNASCAGTRRLWLLRGSPGDGDRVGKLIEKYHMFTLLPVEENVKAMRRRDQVVRQ